MESIGFNGTMVAQLFNLLFLLLIIVGVAMLIRAVFWQRPARMAEDLREIKQRLAELERKLDGKG